MVQIPAKSETERLLINLPKTIALQVTQEQFTALAVANPDLRLEKTAQGELIVNPPTGWETGEHHHSRKRARTRKVFFFAISLVN